MSDYYMPKAVAKSQTIGIGDNTFAIAVNNPLDANYIGLPPMGTVLPSDPPNLTHGVLTVEPDTGRISLRAVDNIGPWQIAKKLGYMAVYNDSFLIPCAF